MPRRPNLNRYFLRWVVRFRTCAGICHAALGGLFLCILPDNSLGQWRFSDFRVEMFDNLAGKLKNISVDSRFSQHFLLFLQPIHIIIEFFITTS